MPFYASLAFARRIGRIEQKHATLWRGAATVLRPDGLMVMQPKPGRGTRVLRIALALGVAFFVLKAALILSAGPLSYKARLAALTQGTATEAALAWVMAVDPVTAAFVDAGSAAARKMSAAIDQVSTRFAALAIQIGLRS